MRTDIIITDKQYFMLLDVLENANIDREDSDEFSELIVAVKEGSVKLY
jgi:hypothetical protein